MRGFVCPANRKYCPSSQKQIELDVRTENQTIKREYTWKTSTTNGLKFPTEVASEWHCKYRIHADRDVVRSLLNIPQPGYIMVDLTLEGFDEFVYFIVQRHGKFKDITPD